MLCEMVAVRGKPIGALVQELMDEFGRSRIQARRYARVGEGKGIGHEAIPRGRQEDRRLRVTGGTTPTGNKFFVDGGWVLVRASVRSRSYASIRGGEHRDGGYAARGVTGNRELPAHH